MPSALSHGTGPSAAAGGCHLTKDLVEGPARDVSLKRERTLGGLDGCGEDEMCLVRPCEQRRDPSREGFTSSLSPWLQERVKAEELVEQRAAQQDQPDGEERQGTDRSGRSSWDVPVLNSRARPTSQRHESGSDRMQHPKTVRARDEF